jgi:hypothetical protein
MNLIELMHISPARCCHRTPCTDEEASWYTAARGSILRFGEFAHCSASGSRLKAPRLRSLPVTDKTGKTQKIQTRMGRTIVYEYTRTGGDTMSSQNSREVVIMRESRT